MSYHKRGSNSYSMQQRRYQPPTTPRRPTTFKRRDVITKEREFLGHSVFKETVKTKSEITPPPSKLTTENQTSGGVGIGDNLINTQVSLSRTNKTELEFDKGKK